MPDTVVQDVTTMEGFDDMLKGIDGLNLGDGNTQQSTSQPTQPSEPSVQDPAQPAAPATPAETAQTDPAQAQPAQSKQAVAFAQMRVQNKQYEEVLQAILQRAGLDPTLAKNVDSLKQMLAEEDTHKQAEELKVPPELLKRLNQLESVNAQFEAQRRQQTAVSGLQQVQNEFKLTEQQVMEFAKQLHENGVNPFEQDVDLMREYKLLNFETIQKQRIDAAVQAALAKQGAAQQHSSTPSAVRSKPDGANSEGKITDMAGFDRFLKELSI